jgi:hypothetical protein
MNKHIEDDIQSEYFRWCALLKIFAFAIPNGGKRNAREGARLKKQGTLAGPQMFLFRQTGINRQRVYS